LSSPAAGAAGIRRHGAQQREQRAHGLADAGGRLRHQAAARAGGAVHRLGQFALAGAEGRHRKRQRRAAPRPAHGAVRRLLRRPGGRYRAGTGLRKTPAALRRVGGLGQHRFDWRVSMLKYTSANVPPAPGPVGLADQPAVDPRLGPVQRALVGALAGQVAAVGLDLFQPVGGRVPAVGAAAHPQRAEVGRQRHLALVARAAPRGDGAVSLPPLRRRWVTG
jgi:hypothetical protein